MREPGLEPDALESPVLAKREEHELMKRRIFLSAALALVCIACGAAERTPRNGLIAADWQGEGIYLVDPANTDRHLIPRTESAGEIAWSPDGRSLAFDLPGGVQGGCLHNRLRRQRSAAGAEKRT